MHAKLAGQGLNICKHASSLQTFKKTDVITQFSGSDTESKQQIVELMCMLCAIPMDAFFTSKKVVGLLTVPLETKCFLSKKKATKKCKED